MRTIRPKFTTAAGLLAATTLALVIAATPAPAQDGRQACEADAFRLCNDAIPDEAKVGACLRKKRISLSPACRAAVFPVKATKRRAHRR
jgi:hypothetical protein